MTLMDWFIVLYVLAFINIIIGTIQLIVFLSRHSSIDSEQDLEDFKQLARLQMYLAMVQLGLLITAGIIGAYGVFTSKLSLLLLLAVNGVIIGISLLIKRIEKRTQTLTVSDENLAQQYKAICASWIKKPFPDF